MEETSLVSEEVSQRAEASVAPKPKRRKVSDQDQQMQNDITEAAMMIGNIEADPELKARLAAYTIDETELGKGKAAQMAAQHSFAERQNSIGTAETAITALQTLWPTLLKEAGDFREIARARIPESGFRMSLGLVGDLPQDRQRVITALKATYTEAKKSEYQDIFGSAFSVLILNERLERVQAAENAIIAARDATHNAKRATEQRNNAIKALRLWTAMVKRIARRALRDRPDLLGKLGV